MSNLIPESRADKNGHVVTRWVKGDRAGDDTPFLPGPSAVPAVGYKISEFLRKSFQSHYMDFPKDIDFNVIEKRLFSLPKITLDLIRETLVGSDDEGWYFSQVIISALDKDLPPKVIDDMTHLYGQLDENCYGDITDYSGWESGWEDASGSRSASGFEGTNVLKEHLAGCARMTTPSFSYDYDGIVPVRLMEDDTASQVLALYNVIGYVSDDVSGAHIRHDTQAGATWLRDERLVDLIVRNHARDSDVIDAMSDRQTLDPEALSLILEDHHHALAEGAL